MLLGGLLLAVALTALPSIVTVALERANRGVWGVLTEGYDGAGEGAYRAVRVARRVVGRAPVSVVAAAWTAFFLGQMVVPGLVVLVLSSLVLLALETVRTPTFIVSVVAGPTGLWLAVRQLVTGRALLQRQPGAETTARRTARFALVQSAAVAGAMIPAALFEDDAAAVPFAALLVVGAALTAAQALLLRRAARDLDRYGEHEWLPDAQVPR